MRAIASNASEKRRSPANRQLVFFAGIAALCTAADQITKHLVLVLLGENGNFPMAGFFSLTYLKNTGICFGLFATGAIRLPVIFGSLAIFLIIFGYVHHRKGTIATVFLTGLALIEGGILGNLIDRIRYGSVIDFLNFHVWPVFNLADSCIVAGVILCLLFQVRSNHVSRLSEDR